MTAEQLTAVIFSVPLVIFGAAFTRWWVKGRHKQ